MSNENETQQAPSLSLNDLVLAANIINLATQRGAFNASEAETVGTIFNKVTRITKELAPKADSEESASQEDTVEGA